MGVPDFDGGWSSMPSMWSAKSVRQVSFALSLAHVINEMKRELVCPLAVREIWAYWNPEWPSPMNLRLNVQWGIRPPVGVKGSEKRPFPTREQLALDLAESKDFWGASAHERDEGILAWPFQPLETLLRKPGWRFSLVYRDTRVEPLAELSAREARLWRARRQTLRHSAGLVGDLFRQMGAAIAYAAMPMPSQRLTLAQIRDAREEGMGLGIEALMNCSTHEHSKEAEIEYDFACREAGQRAIEQGNAVQCMALLQGFFMALSDQPIWGLVAGGGEQEALFGLLCRLEDKWGESLDAIARLRSL